MPRPETYGDRLRRLRNERRLSLKDIASPGATAAYICRLELGERTASIHATRLIAAKLGVAWQYLDSGEPHEAVDVGGSSYDVPEPVARELVSLRAALAERMT